MRNSGNGVRPLYNLGDYHPAEKSSWRYISFGVPDKAQGEKPALHVVGVGLFRPDCRYTRDRDQTLVKNPSDLVEMQVHLDSVKMVGRVRKGRNLWIR